MGFPWEIYGISMGFIKEHGDFMMIEARNDDLMPMNGSFL